MTTKPNAIPEFSVTKWLRKIREEDFQLSMDACDQYDAESEDLEERLRELER